MNFKSGNTDYLPGIAVISSAVLTSSKYEDSLYQVMLVNFVKVRFRGILIFLFHSIVSIPFYVIDLIFGIGAFNFI